VEYVDFLLSNSILLILLSYIMLSLNFFSVWLVLIHACGLKSLYRYRVEDL